MSMKLWIDDLRPAPSGYTHIARNYEQAIALLSNYELQWELVSFDHDLADEHYNNLLDPSQYKEKTGYEIAKWVEEEAYHRRIRKFEWRIHTSNPAGRRRIEAALRNADKYWSQVNNG